MCVAAAPAHFSGTILYHGRCHHAQHGLVHVLGYQNTAANLAAGPNAMLLHLPAIGMTRHNFINTSECPRALRDMVDALSPPAAAPAGRGQGAPAPGGPPPVQIFDHDIYTVVLATDATLIPDALAGVPEHKRIAVNRPLFDFYAAMYPGHAIALCCFDNRAAREAKPLLMWYSPRRPEVSVLPAIDCHTGAVPDLSAHVTVDHWVILGTDEAPSGWGVPVRYSRPHGPAAGFLPDRVVGRRFQGTMPNGDFEIAHEELLRGDLNRLRRSRPGWALPL
jgi:hypothetical protein